MKVQDEIQEDTKIEAQRARRVKASFVLHERFLSIGNEYWTQINDVPERKKTHLTSLIG